MSVIDARHNANIFIFIYEKGTVSVILLLIFALQIDEFSDQFPLIGFVQYLYVMTTTIFPFNQSNIFHDINERKCLMQVLFLKDY